MSLSKTVLVALRRAAIAFGALAILGFNAASAVAAPSLEVAASHIANETQAVEVFSNSGTFRLTFGADTTSDLAATATAGQVQAALNALPLINIGGGSVTVVRVDLGGDAAKSFSYEVTFGGGPLANTDVAEMTVSDGTVPLGGSTARPFVTTPDPAGINRGDESLSYLLSVKNTGTEPTSGTTTVAIDLPTGLKFGGAAAFDIPGWTCRFSASLCTSSNIVAPGGSFPALRLPVWVYPAFAPDSPTATFTAFGGGASNEAIAQDSFSFGAMVPFDVTYMAAGAYDQAGGDYLQAGGHPFSAASSLTASTRISSVGGPILTSATSSSICRPDSSAILAPSRTLAPSRRSVLARVRHRRPLVESS